MKRNHIVVFINRKDEIEMKTRCVLSIFPLGKGKIIVSGHIRQVTIITKRRGGRRKRTTNKSAGILFIEKDVNPAFSVVKCIKVWDGSPLDIPMISFGWDKKENMSGHMATKSKEGKEKQKSKAPKNITANIFEKVNPFAYVKLADAIIEMMEVKPRTAKECIRTMREKAIIEQLNDLSCQLKIL